ncbi:MAG: hypothetical protein KDN22_09765 [Verrucomicrobiae bacterium]|nr:hypothetical protein [Verrucomicrobiae bacterium]
MPSSSIDSRPARRSVGEFLRSQIKPETKLSFVSAFFTVNAYDALKHELESARCLRFLFGKPSFISESDSDKHAKKNFCLTEDGLKLAHSLAQRPSLSVGESFDWHPDNEVCVQRRHEKWQRSIEVPPIEEEARQGIGVGADQIRGMLLSLIRTLLESSYH